MILRLFLFSISLYLAPLEINASPLIKDAILVDPAPSNQTITDETLRNAIQFAQMLISSSYSIPNENYTYHKGDTIIMVNVTSGSVTDPSQFTVDKAHVNMSALEFQVHLTFPTINVTGQYFLNATTDLGKVFGNGPFRLNTTGIEAEVDVTLAEHQNKTLYLKNINFDYNVTSSKVRFDGLLNDTEACNLINDYLNVFVPDALHDFKPDIDGEASTLAENYSAFLFKNVTLEQLIKFVNGIGG